MHSGGHSEVRADKKTPLSRKACDFGSNKAHLRGANPKVQQDSGAGGHRLKAAEKKMEQEV